MNKKREKNNKDTCPYCGEAPVNHRLFYIENLFSSVMDPHMLNVTQHAPKFIKDFASWVPVALFKLLKLFGLAHFSKDIEKAKSFRSRVIWEEAQRRGIDMEQVILGQRPLDWYRACINGKYIYFESLPILPEFLDMRKDWDDKVVLKKEFLKHGIPVPKHFKFTYLFRKPNLKRIFSKFDTSVIVKPQVGSRARHTVTNISTIEHFEDGVSIVNRISHKIVVEEHLQGFICRATVVGGVLAGFYKGSVPTIIGDGTKTIRQLIEEKNSKQNARYQVRISNELHDHIFRFGFKIDDILPKEKILTLSHRAGQLFGGMTTEMIDDLHPSFIPILEKAAKVTGLSIAGLDCIIPDPTKDESTQRWGIIECNTLPFIDMHYYALEGKPRNIAGMIWDLWK